MLRKHSNENIINNKVSRYSGWQTEVAKTCSCQVHPTPPSSPTSLSSVTRNFQAISPPTLKPVLVPSSKSLSINPQLTHTRNEADKLATRQATQENSGKSLNEDDKLLAPISLE